MENNEFIKDINFKEKLLLDFLQTDVPKYVSHYTGAEAATSIIKTHKLRFTLASTFSDFTEDECFYDLIEDIKRSDAVFKDFYMAYIEVKNNIKKENLYICCFSSEDDSAGMWNYGEGRDVNLLLNLREISLSLLHDNFVSESFRFDILRVIYNENEIYDYLFNIINSFYLL